MMPDPTREGQRRVELFVREDLPGPIRERRRDLRVALEALTADGAIDSYSVCMWAKRRPIGGGDAAATDVSFGEWACAAGVELSPFFDTRECYSPTTGQRDEWLIRPALCLAVYEAEDLVAVYPHRDADGRTRTVADGIASLRGSTAVEAGRPLAGGVAD